MSNEDNHDREGEVRERIFRLMQSLGQSRGKQITAEEQQKLKAATSRLDQLLKDAAAADQQELKSAATRLDQLLSDIQTGKDFTKNIKRRNNRQSQNG